MVQWGYVEHITIDEKKIRAPKMEKQEDKSMPKPTWKKKSDSPTI